MSTTNINQQEVGKLIAQYDKEAATRQLAGPMKWITFCLLVLFSLYQLASTLFSSSRRKFIGRSTWRSGFVSSTCFIREPPRAAKEKSGS